MAEAPPVIISVLEIKDAGMPLRSIELNKSEGCIRFPSNRTSVRRAPSPRRSTVVRRSEEHTSELQSLMRISYAVFCLQNKTDTVTNHITHHKSSHQQLTQSKST